MSRIRKAVVAVVSIVAIAVVIGAMTNAGGRHGPAAAPAVVHVVTPTASTPAVPPSADFEAETFLNLLTHVAPAVAAELVNALSPADRAALATDLETRTGLAAS